MRWPKAAGTCPDRRWKGYSYPCYRGWRWIQTAVLGCKNNKERCNRESVRRTHRLKVSEDGPRDNWWFCQRGRWYPNRSLVERAFGGQVILILSFYFNYSNARVWASGSGYESAGTGGWRALPGF